METILYKPIDEQRDYWIGSDGALFSIKSYNGRKAADIKWQYHDRYVCATIRIANKPTRVYQHRLLAIAFIPNPKNKKEVNHIDFNKFNNNLSNLEWSTPKENSSHYSSNNQLKYENVKNCIVKNESIIEAQRLIQQGLSVYKIAKMLNFKYGTLRMALISNRAKELKAITS